MLDEILTRKCALKRHLDAPLLKEREEFLSYLSSIGTGRPSMQNMASWLLRVIKVLKLKRLRDVDVKEITTAARRLAQQTGSNPPRLAVAELFTYAAIPFWDRAIRLAIIQVLEGWKPPTSLFTVPGQT